MEIRNDLQYNLCIGCGEIEGAGIIWIISHSCPKNTFNYLPRKFTLRLLRNTINGVDDLRPFKDLLYFPHFDKMMNFDEVTDLEKKIYSICRESEIRTMKRLRNYIEFEERLNSKY